MDLIHELLDKSAHSHHRLCPRQVLGVRMGLYAGRILNLQLPRADKRLFTFIETDGCTVDGVAASTGCSVGRRTMRIVDFGKIAATFVDRETLSTIRIAPGFQARDLAKEYAPGADDEWNAYLQGYQVMPDEKLFQAQAVKLAVSLDAIISRESARINCDRCGEEIFNEREVVLSGLTLCRSCAGEAYYFTTKEIV